jgi:FAD/FMN-containing dehydrogenase
VTVPTQLVQSWGRLSVAPHIVMPVADRTRGLQAAGRTGTGIPYGNGRSYGDVCLNPGGALWTMRGLDRFIAFDGDTGVLECESGVLLREVLEVAVPAGWFLPVVPGTEFATVGGAVANDVHGKNHHRMGSFGDHVLALELERTDGHRILCGPDHEAAWFRATVGGLGLTGLVLRVKLQLRPVPGPWVEAEALPFGSLDEFFAISAASEAQYEYGVAWVDCTGRSGAKGVFFRGNHVADTSAAPALRARAFPLTPPISLVNGLSLRAFNRLYRARYRRPSHFRRHYRSFFFPLDGILHWNRLYGPRGFYQYQCVVPRAVQIDATRDLMAIIARSGEGSFLSVLKTFGDRVPVGLLSFPMPGTTLALDFPNLGDRTRKLFATLDHVVREAGGRLYAAKDALMPRDLFEAGYPELESWRRFRDPGVASALSRRLIDD